MRKLSSFGWIILLSISTIVCMAPTHRNGRPGHSPDHDDHPSLSGATGWLNTQPLNLEALHGKVVLIDFWTYTCINWRRTMPYVREWATKYKDQGLVVIGVHTPEFSFEHDLDNITQASKELDITYPIAVDADYAIWTSFHNNYWPALYLIDAQGKIRYQKFGEGDYAQEEQMIQQLLKEASPNNAAQPLSTLHPDGFEAAADWEHLQSPENYVGYRNTQGFASPGGIVPDEQTLYNAPKNLALNEWALSGKWTILEEKVIPAAPQGKLVYRFHARNINLIMARGAKKEGIKFRMLIDGHAPGNDHGSDIDADGNGVITAPRMYQLVRQQGVIADHVFQVEFEDAGAEVYDFTFG